MTDVSIARIKEVLEELVNLTYCSCPSENIVLEAQKAGEDLIKELEREV